MKRWQKVLAAALSVPALLLASYVGYLAATYIDETVTDGSAYGFDIGSSKQQALSQASMLRESYPDAAVYVSFGPRRGDRFAVVPSEDQLDRLQSHDHWSIHLDGEKESSDTVGLTFHNGKLVRIRRHRQHFEFP